MLFETMRFWSEVAKPHQPQGWTLKNTIVYETDTLKLRQFTPIPGNKVPILVLAPNAGHHQNICEPLLRRCLKVDAERAVYVIEWVPPTPRCDHRTSTLDDAVGDIAACVERIGSKVHLLAQCQGAWAGAIYASLHPDRVASYVNAAGPIDFCAGDGKLQSACQALPMPFFETMVAMGGGVQRGENQLFGFKGMNPWERYFGDYLDLWTAVCQGDEKGIRKWRRFKEWYDQPMNLPGTWYLEVVEKLFKKNLLIKGELVVLGRRVDLKNIDCPVFLIAGDKDDITLPEQVFNMADYVSGPTTTKLLENAGHIGVFVKESSLDYWETSVLRTLEDIDSGKGPVFEKVLQAA